MNDEVSTDALASELLVSVYLDTNLLIDLLATIEDGFALVERVTTGQTASRGTEQDGNLEVGAPGVFSLFKFSGRLGRSTTKESAETTESERTHTYGSMLHRLRRFLIDEGLLVQFGNASATALEVGAFVELRGTVRPNPFTDSFERLRRMLGFVEVALAMEGHSSTQSQSSKGKKPPGHRGQVTPQQTQLAAMNQFLNQLMTDVEREGTSTVVVDCADSDYKAVATLFEGFLRDRSMVELLNREFRLLGKVARHEPIGSSGAVDLLASTGISGFPPELLEKLSDGIESLSGTGANVAAPSTAIHAPALEVIPIAIYL